MNTFSCRFAARSTACVFDHCDIGICVFSLSFRADLWCILASFCMILCTRLEAWSRYMNGHQSNSKRVICITFWNVFRTGKIPLPVTLAGFSEKWSRNLVANKWSIFEPFVHGYCVFWFFHATSKKTWYARRFMSARNISQGYSVQPKMSKKWRLPKCRCVRRRAKWGKNSGLGGHVIFPYV